MSFIEMIEDVLPEDWSVHDPQMGLDCLLVCPHGDVIEQDGTCPEGCESPLRGLGLI